MKKYEIKQLENDCWELKFEDKDYYKVVAKLTHNHILQYNALSNSDKTNFEDSIPYGLTSFDKAVNTFNGKTKYTYYEETLPLGVEMFQKTCETYNNKKHKTKFSTWLYLCVKNGYLDRLYKEIGYKFGLRNSNSFYKFLKFKKLMWNNESKDEIKEILQISEKIWLQFNELHNFKESNKFLPFVSYTETNENSQDTLDIVEEINNIVSKMEGRQPEIFNLYYNEHMTIKEISEKIGISLQAVRMHKKNICKKIKKEIKK